MTSSLRIALESLLGRSVGDFVRERRSEGVAWRRIAIELYDETGVDVAHESLRQWFPDEGEEPVA